MAEQPTFYTVTGPPLPAFESMPGDDGLKLEQAAPRHFLRSYLDTPDWRLFNSSSTLELHQYQDRVVLIWRALDSGRIKCSASLTEIPQRAGDIAAEDFRTQLERITKGRALQVVAGERVTVRALKLVDQAANRGLRLDLEVTQSEHSLGASDERVYARLRCAGDGKNLSHHLRSRAESLLGLQPLSDDPLRTLLGSQGIHPERISKNPKLRRGDGNFVAALARLQLELLDLLEQQESGLFEDVDDEFLHDFRIACRRSRTLLPELAASLPAKQRRSISADFSWLSQLTGPLRDLDVVLAEFDELAQRLPDGHGDLEPLHEILQSERQRHLAAMRTALASRRYGKFKRSWRGILGRLLNKQRNGGLRKPVDASLKKTYRRVIKQVFRLHDHIELDAFHDLRKRCKRLRYRLDAFRSLYPTSQVQEVISTLKGFQDDLGRINDLHVQGELFSAALAQLDKSEPWHDATLASANHLVDLLNAEKTDRLRHLQDALSEFAAERNQSRFGQLLDAGYE